MPSKEKLLEGAAGIAAAREAKVAAAVARRDEGRELYSDDKGQPVLRDSWAVYLDMLGTRAAIAELDDAALRRQIALLDRLTTDLHDPQYEDFFQRLVSFSDNIALSVPMSHHGGSLLGLGMLMLPVAAFQLEMTVQNRFLRGGVAGGRLYSDYTHVTGPALLAAVRLEEEVAVFPRILLDELAVAVALKDSEDYSQPYLSPWNG